MMNEIFHLMTYFLKGMYVIVLFVEESYEKKIFRKKRVIIRIHPFIKKIL